VVGPRSHTDQPLQVEIAPASAQAEITVTRTSFSPSGDSSIVRRDFRLSIDAIEHAVPVRFSDGRSGGIEAPVFLSSLVEGAPAAETLCRNATPWRSEVRTSSISGFASGFGDEPARQHSVSLADGTRFTVTYVWIRLPNRWIATERVIKNADGHEIERTSLRLPQALSLNTVPRVDCAAVRPTLTLREEPDGDLRRQDPTAPSAVRELTTGLPLQESLICVEPCRDERWRMEDALTNYRIQLALAVAVCGAALLPPTPAGALACAGAVAAAEVAHEHFLRAEREYLNCISRPRKPGELDLSTDAFGIESAPANGGAPYCDDGGGGGGAGEGTLSCQTYVIEISYDGGDTWTELYRWTQCSMQ